MAPLARTIREQVTDLIRDDVVAGKFPSGQPLRESEIAERFGVSRGPIRDAFLQLSQEGFLGYQANRGVTVRHPPDAYNRDFIISLRHQIETFAVKSGVKNLSDDHIGSIDATLTELQAACDSEDVAAIARCDMAFHQSILEACGGEDFLPIWKWLCSQMLLTYSRVGDFAQIYREHVAIMNAVRDRNGKATVAAIKANVR